MKTAVITLLALFFLVKSDKKNCYVLALEGGGDKGAYQAGAIKGLVDYTSSGEVEWDVVTGISVGSMNAAGLSIFAPGDEKSASDFLVSTWRKIKGSGDIYKNWFAGPLEGLFFKSGIFDTSPLRNIIQETVKNETLKRKFVCGATNFNTGSYDTWDENVLYRNDYEGAIVSSSSVPVLFPVTSFNNSFYMDGGVKMGVDIASGINKCIDMGFVDEDIIVDVVLLTSKEISPQDASGVHPLGVLIRMLEIQSYDSSMSSFDYMKQVFPNVKFRYVVAPTKALPSGNTPLIFSPSQIETMINYGLQDAQNVINKGEGKNLEELLRDYMLERQAYTKRKTNLNEKKKDSKLEFLSSNENIRN
jgi:predicted acylesterase/phospholipase RssA